MAETSETRILLPHILDAKASLTPNAVWTEFPVSSTSYDQGYRSITYQQLSRATHEAAFYLKSHVPPSDEEFPTLAYIGPADVRYSILLHGAIRAGMKMFFTSPRNSIAAHIELLEKVKCKVFLVPDPQPPPVTALLKEYPIPTARVPSLDDFLSATPEHFPYQKTYDQAVHDEIFVLHTSGSTGIPKPLTYTHEYISSGAAINQLTPPSGFVSFNESLHGKRIILFLPSFHIAGLYYNTINTLYNRSTIILPLPSGIPTAQTLVDVLSHTSGDAAFLSPATLEELAKLPELLDIVASKLHVLFYSGASLPLPAMLKISAQIPVIPFYGSSEYGSWPMLLPREPRPADESHYLNLHPAINAKMRHRTADLFELVLPYHPARKHLLTPFQHYPEVRAYHTRDLFTPHPTKHGYWAYQGRLDDIIVFVNGEKTNPTEFEGHVASNPAVKSCLMLGASRAEAALLIELADNNTGPERFDQILTDIWPTIEAANERSPAHAQVARDRIILTCKPFARAGKGTVQRAATLSLFAAEINELYDATGDRDQHAGPRGPLTTDQVCKLVAKVCGIPDVQVADDFFQLGMDSLRILQLVREFRSQLGYEVKASTVMAHPTAEQLTTAISRNSG